MATKIGNRASTHNADNTWTTAGSVMAVQAGTTILAGFVTGNVFKHMGQPGDANASNSWNRELNTDWRELRCLTGT